jgi:hypothetical protein
MRALLPVSLGWLFLMLASCGNGAASGSACANKQMCACGDNMWCESGGSWSRCAPLPDDPGNCGKERFPGECRQRLCSHQPDDDGGEPESDAGSSTVKDAPVDVPMTPGRDGDVLDTRAGDDSDGTPGPVDGSVERPGGCTNGQTRACAADGLLGNCAKGIETCAAGVWGACSVAAASADRCDAVGDDANCNGKPNEGCPCVTGETQACGPSANQGICQRGTQTCANAQWGACQGAVYAKARDCASALDNDCDGRADNTIDSTCQCAPTTTRSCGTHPQDGVGRCRAGSQTCNAGSGNSSSAWGGCSGSVGPAGSDSCDPGDDSNCNGTKNEGCGCVSGASRSCAQDGKLGNCGGGTESCVNGSWGACSVSAASADRCDVVGDDANCNGKTNEGCRTLGQGCSGNGDCQSTHCVQSVCCATTCPAGSASSCGNDGSCDSNGVCRKFGSSTMCSSASCGDRSNSHEAGFCSNGSCQTGAQCDYHGCGSNNRCTTSCPNGTNDTGSQCQPCGGIGQPCCTTGNACRVSQSICNDPTNVCKSCGNIAEPCCGSQRTTASGFFAPLPGNCFDGSICSEHVGSGWSCDD